MKIELDTPDAHLYRIDSYGRGVICINGQHITASLIVSPHHLVNDWPPKSIHDIAAQHLELILELKPEIIILGTGQHLHFPASGLVSRIYELGIGFEAMDTGAACRCYNLLLSEGRNIAAGLIMPDS
jgi:Uncharacterized conserved protein